MNPSPMPSSRRLWFPNPSIVKGLLPPYAACICSRIRLLRDSGSAKVKFPAVVAIEWKSRQSRPPWNAAGGETGDVLLQSDGKGAVSHPRLRTTSEKGIRDVHTMQGGWNGKLIGVRAVVVCAIEIVSVAGEDRLGDDQGLPRKDVFVAQCAVVNGWIQHREEIIGRLCRNGRKGPRDEGRKRGLVGNGRIGKGQSFIRIVTDHHLDLFVKGSLQE